MATIFDAIFTSNAVELLSVMWAELLMASLAALMYCVFSGTVRMPKKLKNIDSGNHPAKSSPRSNKSTTRNSNSKPVFANAAPNLCTPASDAQCKEEDERPKQKNVVNEEATTALRQGNLCEAIAILGRPENLTCEGNVPANIAPRLLMAVAKARNFDEIFSRLKTLAGKIEQRALEAVVLEAAQKCDKSACRQLLVLSAPMRITKSDRSLEALARVFASDMGVLRMLVDDSQAPLPKIFAGAVLEACAALHEVDLATEVFEKVSEADEPALRILAEKASGATVPQALNTNEQPATRSPKSAGSEMASLVRTVKEIQAAGKKCNLNGAVKLFDRVPRLSRNSFLYNALLDACIECGEFQKAHTYFNQADSENLLDVISYNTMMKGYLASAPPDEASAARLLAEMTGKGLVPTHLSYHGLINARVRSRDSRGAWKLVEEMQAAGLVPTNYTCAILLKARATSPAEISQILKMVDATGEPVDEILFGGIVEACTRANCLHVLSEQTAKFARQGGSLALSEKTYGSMIKAHGQLWDVNRVWELWNEMISNDVQPSSVTLGVMVEALVSNRRTPAAWKLAQEILSDEKTEAIVNHVTFATIMKGFAAMKDVDKVMELYEEMHSRGVKANTITYNTVLNAFAQAGQMAKVPALLQDMQTATPPVEPDVVSYSTIVKGFCNAGSFDQAFQFMNDMKSNGKFEPDEVTYNSLLDGCARENRPDDALKLISDMKAAGIKPSNFTLSMVVKIFGRCKRLNQAFTLIEEITTEYNFKVNIPVYTCLIQACFNNKQAFKALTCYEKMTKDGLWPDDRTYDCLIKGFLQAGLAEKAAQITKRAISDEVYLDKRRMGEVVTALGGPESKEGSALAAEIEARPSAPRKAGKGFSKGGT